MRDAYICVTCEGFPFAGVTSAALRVPDDVNDEEGLDLFVAVYFKLAVLNTKLQSHF